MVYTSPADINMSNGFMSIIYYVNNITNQWFANLLLLTIWIVILAGFYKAKDDFSGALAVAGFITFVLGLFAWVSGFISGPIMAIITGIAIVSALVFFGDRGNN